jgi:molecular chaperone GrpE
MSDPHSPHHPHSESAPEADNLSANDPETIPAPGSEALPDPARQIAELTEKLAAREDDWLRARAEAENARRRAQEEVSKTRKFAVEKFANDLLAVKDSLEAALASHQQSAEALKNGVELTLKQLDSAFEKADIVEIAPAPGDKFDPNQHQAIQTEASEQDPNTITRVLQKGYLIAERVLRPAMVFVARTQDKVTGS